MSSSGNDGTGRQAYEKPNCGSTSPHGQHFHSPIGGLTLNCPGVAEKPDDAGISRARVQRVLDEVRARWAPGSPGTAKRQAEVAAIVISEIERDLAAGTREAEGQS